MAGLAGLLGGAGLLALLLGDGLSQLGRLLGDGFLLLGQLAGGVVLGLGGIGAAVGLRLPGRLLHGLLEVALFLRELFGLLGLLLAGERRRLRRAAGLRRVVLRRLR